MTLTFLLFSRTFAATKMIFSQNHQFKNQSKNLMTIQYLGKTELIKHSFTVVLDIHSPVSNHDFESIPHQPNARHCQICIPRCITLSILVQVYWWTNRYWIECFVWTRSFHHNHLSLQLANLHKIYASWCNAQSILSYNEVVHIFIRVYFVNNCYSSTWFREIHLPFSFLEQILFLGQS